MAGAVLGGNWLLENYRAEQAREQFLTGKRLEALTDDAAAMSGVTAVYFAYTGTKKNEPEELAKKDFTKAMEHAREVINKSQFLFGDGLNADTDRFYAVLANIKEVSKKQWPDYNDLVMDLTRRYDHICRAAIEKGKQKGDKGSHLPLEPIPPEERVKLTPEQYLERQLDFWVKHKDEVRFNP